MGNRVVEEHKERSNGLDFLKIRKNQNFNSQLFPRSLCMRFGAPVKLKETDLNKFGSDPEYMHFKRDIEKKRIDLSGEFT